MAILTFLTDFGLSESYVAEMKAAALTIAPRATVIDITHNIPPQNVTAASLVLGRAIDAFPPGTIHIAVVDPGVGTERQLLAVRIASQIVLCPDNGLITWAWRTHANAKASAITWKPKHRQGVTFDGRDRFAPVAAMLLKKHSLPSLARRIDAPVLLDLAPATCGNGCIVHIDFFGNAITNIPSKRLTGDETILVNARSIGRLHATYADVAVGCALALMGSSGLLEIAVRNGSAASKLKLKVGDRVSIVRKKYATRRREGREDRREG